MSQQNQDKATYYRELSGSRGYDDCPQAPRGARAAVLQALLVQNYMERGRRALSSIRQ